MLSVNNTNQYDLTVEHASVSLSSTSSSEDIAQWIKHEAKRLGFEQACIVSLAELNNRPAWQAEQAHLDEWLARGFHSEMDWMERYREIRQDVGQLMADGVAKTVVVVALNYAQIAASPEAFSDMRDKTSLKVSTYAWGKDYHKLIRKRLAKLLKGLQAVHPDIQGRAVTDSAPVLEKALAIQAGLGWQGKNTLVIHPKKGSYFFIGELILDIELPTDSSVITDHCGTCTRCITACPTDALSSTERVLDASKCISYWTIESDAPNFPAPVQENLQGWVFGCDICQQVCPWNERFSEPTMDQAFAPKVWAKPNEVEVAQSITLEEFQKLFENTSIRRSGQAKISRNIELVKSEKAVKQKNLYKQGVKTPY